MDWNTCFLQAFALFDFLTSMLSLRFFPSGIASLTVPSLAWRPLAVCISGLRESKTALGGLCHPGGCDTSGNRPQVAPLGNIPHTYSKMGLSSPWGFTAHILFREVCFLGARPPAIADRTGHLFLSWPPVLDIAVLPRACFQQCKRRLLKKCILAQQWHLILVKQEWPRFVVGTQCCSTVVLDHINSTIIYVMWREEQLCNVSVLKTVHFLKLFIYYLREFRFSKCYMSSNIFMGSATNAGSQPTLPTSPLSLIILPCKQRYKCCPSSLVTLNLLQSDRKRTSRWCKSVWTNLRKVDLGWEYIEMIRLLWKNAHTRKGN